MNETPQSENTGMCHNLMNVSKLQSLGRIIINVEELSTKKCNSTINMQFKKTQLFNCIKHDNYNRVFFLGSVDSELVDILVDLANNSIATSHESENTGMLLFFIIL